MMKKIFLLAICIWQQTTQAQMNTKIMGEEGNCPEGYCAGFFVEIENFNFHKPRTECKSGFGICLRISAGATCIPCLNKITSNDKSSVITGYLSKEMATLHLPKSLQKEQIEKESDFRFFEIEEKTIEITYPDGSVMYLKGGSYPVTEENNELLVRIPVE